MTQGPGVLNHQMFATNVVLQVGECCRQRCSWSCFSRGRECVHMVILVIDSVVYQMKGDVFVAGPKEPSRQLRVELGGGGQKTIWDLSSPSPQ